MEDLSPLRSGGRKKKVLSPPSPAARMCIACQDTACICPLRLQAGDLLHICSACREPFRIFPQASQLSVMYSPDLARLIARGASPNSWC